jgi:hypothetical protein
MTQIDRPILIVGTGRSGSTVFHRVLARHRDVGFLSTLNQSFPSWTWLSVFSRLYPLHTFAKIRDHRLFPKPFSPYRFWEQYLPGITRHDRPLVPEDVPEVSIEPLRRTIGKILRLQGKTRFVAKITGWSRMAYFHRVFPEMRFIYLKRQPRDVVSSWIQAGWLNVSVPVDGDSWEWGDVPEEYIAIWRDMGRHPILSAAIKTQLDIDDIRRNMALFPGRCFELDYEAFVSDPFGQLRATLAFAELDWSADFERSIRETAIRDCTDKWKQFMSQEEGDLLAAFFERVQDAKCHQPL